MLGVPVWKLLGLPRSGPPTSWTIWLGDPDDMARRTELVGNGSSGSSSSSAEATGSTSSGSEPSAHEPIYRSRST